MEPQELSNLYVDINGKLREKTKLNTYTSLVLGPSSDGKFIVKLTDLDFGD